MTSPWAVAMRGGATGGGSKDAATAAALSQLWAPWPGSSAQSPQLASLTEAVWFLETQRNTPKGQPIKKDGALGAKNQSVAGLWLLPSSRTSAFPGDSSFLPSDL